MAHQARLDEDRHGPPSRLVEGQDSTALDLQQHRDHALVAVLPSDRQV